MRLAGMGIQIARLEERMFRLEMERILRLSCIGLNLNFHVSLLIISFSILLYSSFATTSNLEVYSL
jgi:hypothetical protein